MLSIAEIYDLLESACDNAQEDDSPVVNVPGLGDVDLADVKKLKWNSITFKRLSKLWFVEENGLGNVGDICSCDDFATITDRGSVVITGNLGPFLKVNDHHWVRTAPSVSKRLWSDFDLVNQLILEYEDNEYIATVIDPGL